MKILMTGMASAHCSTKGNTTFFSGLYKAFSEFAEVTLSEPKLYWTRADLESFDLVVLGMTPPTSMAANKIYAAFHVLNLLYESPKLRLVVDSNQIWQYKNSIASFKRSPDSIFNVMYRSRKDYTEAKNNHIGSYKSLADKMSAISWPKTYLPILPWTTTDSAAEATGFVPNSRAIGIQVDSFLLDRKDTSGIIRSSSWAVDNVKSKWWEMTSQGLTRSAVPTNLTKKSKDAEIENVISSSFALVVTPQDRKVGTWWNYKYIQALNTGTPIITYWQDTASFSEAWSKLAYQVEDMDIYDRQELARVQFIDYIDSVPNTSQVVHRLQNDLIESMQERI